MALLVDQSPRVRELARWRSRRRGIDAAAWYRDQLAVSDTPACALAASLDGLALLGGPEDLEFLTSHLRHRSARVRAAAVTGVSARASRDDALAILEPVLLDSSPRVSSVSARARPVGRRARDG